MIAFLLSSIYLLGDGLWLCFAGLNALVPRATKVCVTCTSAAFEPRTTVTATTRFAGFLDGAALGARETVDSRSDRWCLYVDIGQDDKE